MASAEGPVFDQWVTRVSVAEDKPPGTAVTRLEAKTSSENGLIYSIVGGDPRRQFSIDYQTGEL